MLHKERLIDGVTREVREETGLSVRPDRLIGIYAGFKNAHCINFVFHSMRRGEPGAAPSDEVLEVKWFTPSQVLKMRDHELLNPRKLKQVIRDFENGSAIPLTVISEDMYGVA